jgi:hypothetical protein
MTGYGTGEGGAVPVPILKPAANRGVRGCPTIAFWPATPRHQRRLDPESPARNTSAVPPIATELVRRNELTRCARSESRANEQSTRSYGCCLGLGKQIAAAEIVLEQFMQGHPGTASIIINTASIAFISASEAA